MKPGWWFRELHDAQWLSSDARLLIGWFATRSRGWRYSMEGNAAALGWGLQKYKKVLREGKASGYLSFAYKRNKSGHINQVSLIVRDKPEGRKSALGGAKPRADSKPAGQKAENHPGIRSLRKDSASKAETTVVAFDRRASNA